MVKIKHNFLNNKAAFTLVEMVVVMSILGILSLIGISALISAKNESYVDAAAELFLTEIREAQNNAIAIKGGTDVRAWVVNLPSSPTNFTVEDFYIRTGGLSLNNRVDFTHQLNTVTVKVERGTKSGAGYNYSTVSSGPSLYAAYTTPFGTPYIFIADPLYRGCVSTSYTVCKWEPWMYGSVEKPSKEWKLTMTESASAFYLSQNHNSDQIIRVTFTGNGKTKSVIINSSGDAFIE